MLSKLEAVNLILDGIGEDPVNSLTSGNPDAEAAERRLDRTKIDVLSKGWHCNTREDVQFTADANGYITVTGSAIDVDTVGTSGSTDVVLDSSDSKLIDRENNTKIFTVGKTLRCRVVYNLDWDVLPYSLRRYIAARAAREFQGSAMGSAELDGFTSRDEQIALAEAVSADMATRDLNILKANRNWGRPRVRRWR